MIVESGESEIYIDESVISDDLNDYSINDVMSLNSYTDEYYESNKIKINLKKI